MPRYAFISYHTFLLDTAHRMQTLSLYAIAVMFIVTGIAHFVKPGLFTRIMPPYLPAPKLLVYVSGAFEVAGGVGVLVPDVQVYAAWGLIALLVAVFPVHVYMVNAPEKFDDIPTWVLWFRLPLQFVLMAWVYWTVIA